MRTLRRWTGGLVGERDPAQPLVTLLDNGTRVELSGATTANWVAKTAHLLVDGLGSPARVGVALPLHWQAVVAVIGAVVAGAEVVLARDLETLSPCDAVFTTADEAGSLLSAGVPDVLVVSMHPLGLPLPVVDPAVVDHARDVLAFGDKWTGPITPRWVVEASGVLLDRLPPLGLGRHDRVLVSGDPADAAVCGVLLAVLHEGGALVLVPAGAEVDLDRAVAAEQVTATAGVTVSGVRAI